MALGVGWKGGETGAGDADGNLDAGTDDGADVGSGYVGLVEVGYGPGMGCGGAVNAVGRCISCESGEKDRARKRSELESRTGEEGERVGYIECTDEEDATQRDLLAYGEAEMSNHPHRLDEDLRRFRSQGCLFSRWEWSCKTE